MSAQQINGGKGDDQKWDNSAGHAEKEGIAEEKNVQFGTAAIQFFKNSLCFKPIVHFTLDRLHFCRRKQQK